MRNESAKSTYRFGNLRFHAMRGMNRAATCNVFAMGDARSAYRLQRAYNGLPNHDKANNFPYKANNFSDKANNFHENTYHFLHPP